MNRNLQLATDYAIACGFTALYLPYLVGCFVVEQMYRGGE